MANGVLLSLRSDMRSNVGQVPGSEVHWATGLPTGSTFDYRTLMGRGCIDLVLNMDYCTYSRECIANKIYQTAHRFALAVPEYIYDSCILWSRWLWITGLPP